MTNESLQTENDLLKAKVDCLVNMLAVTYCDMRLKKDIQTNDGFLVETKKGDFPNALVNGGMYLNEKHNQALEELFSNEFKNKFPWDWSKVSSSS
jgi:hypothetical protein